MEDREAVLEKLDTAVERFVEAVVALPDSLFLTRMNGWSPRDVAAHLIGWNRLTITSCDEILRGVRPSYLGDIDEGFRHVNAASVRKYDSEHRDRLLDELRASAAATARFARSLEPASWKASVHFRRWTISVENCMDGLRQDYDTHRERIEMWAAGYHEREEDR